MAITEQVRIQNHQWYVTHKTEHREQMKKWVAEHPGKMAEYQRNFRERDPDRTTEIIKRFREKNPDSCKIASQKFRDKYPVRVKEIQAKWKAANPIAYKVHHANGRHRRTEYLKNTPLSERVKVGQWKDLVSWWGMQCAYCGCPLTEVHVDHVVPVSHGGAHRIDNILPVCKHCNSSKNNKPLEEWMGASPSFSEHAGGYSFISKVVHN